jgi:hypothetical protein
MRLESISESKADGAPVTVTFELRDLAQDADCSWASKVSFCNARTEFKIVGFNADIWLWAELRCRAAVPTKPSAPSGHMRSATAIRKCSREQ